MERRYQIDLIYIPVLRKTLCWSSYDLWFIRY